MESTDSRRFFTSLKKADSFKLALFYSLAHFLISLCIGFWNMYTQNQSTLKIIKIKLTEFWHHYKMYNTEVPEAAASGPHL